MNRIDSIMEAFADKEGIIDSEKLKEQRETVLSKDFTGAVRWPDNVVVYYKNGTRHREDGPAVITKYYYYYLEGRSLSFKQYWDKQKNTIHASKIMAYNLGEK